MGSEWPKVKIDDIKGNSNGAIAIGPFGSRMKSDCYVEDGIPVIRGTNITGGPVFEGSFVYITEKLASTLGPCNVYKNDLVFPHRGSIGEVGIIIDDKRYVISSSLMKLTCDTNRVNPKFLYYFFRSYIGKYQLLKNASQVGTPGIGQPLTSLKGIELRLPPLTDQNTIDRILSTLDDKIELNRQMNSTLESMAQAVFKSWFVDFDPVIDNALAAGNPIPEPLKTRAEARKRLGDQRKPLPQEIQELFPSRFVFTEDMGWIPEGWEVKSIGEVLDLVYGKSLPTKKRIEGNVLVYGSGGIAGTHNEQLIDGPGIVVGRKGTVGSIYWVDDDFFPIDTVFYVRCKFEVPLFWVYQSLQLVDIKSLSADSAVPGVNRNSVYTRKIIIPSKQVLNEYESQIIPVNSKHLEIDRQSLTLTSLRDTLLPKLISGQLRLPDSLIDKFTEQASSHDAEQIISEAI